MVLVKNVGVVMGDRDIAVILTVYNMESCLEETLDSILGQTYAGFDLICVNDGSDDSSLEILCRYAEEDDRIKVVSQSNMGQGAARNAGLDMAETEYVIFLDADDVYRDDMLEKMHDRAERLAADIVVCRAEEMDHSSRVTTPAPWTIKATQVPSKECFSAADLSDYAFTAFIGWPWDKLYRRSFIEAEDLRFPHLDNSEDLYFVFLSIVLADSISVVDEVLVSHRVNRGGSVSNSRTRSPFAFYDAVCALKKRLRAIPACYDKLSWGFLNWSLDYTLWNIESLPQGMQRKLVLDAFASGRLVEIEADRHCLEFYSLVPDLVLRIDRLAKEKKGLGLENGKAKSPHFFASRLASFFSYASVEGYASAIFRVISWLRGRNIRDGVNADRGNGAKVLLSVFAE